MARYALVALSFVLAGSEFMSGNPAGLTFARQLSGSLSYAFSPLLLAVVLSGNLWALQRTQGRATTFVSDVGWMWGVMLPMLMISHVCQMKG
jgi:hypothetical protein